MVQGIPSKWQIKPLSEIAKIKGGKRVPKGEKLVYENTGFPYIRVADFTESGTVNLVDIRYVTENVYEQIKSYTIDSADLYISIAGTIGKAGIVPEVLSGANLTENACKLVFNECVFNKYAYYFTQTDYFLEQAGLNTRVAAMPKLALSRLGTIKLPFPPIPVQKRIVAILDQAFSDIEQARAKTEQNLLNARELFESVCSTSIFSSDSEPACSVFDVAKDEKGSMRTGPFGSQLLKNEIVDKGIAVLGIDNAVDNSFKWGAKRFITYEKFEKLSRFEVKPGDVLITIMGTCGRCAIVPENIPKAINTKHICCITLDRNKCLPEYLHAYFLYHPIAKEYLLSRAKGAIMAGLNMGIIKELPLVLPTIQEQKRLVSQIGLLKNNIDCLEAMYRSKVASLDELKKSILQKAFSGELTKAPANKTKRGAA